MPILAAPIIATPPILNPVSATPKSRTTTRSISIKSQHKPVAKNTTILRITSASPPPPADIQILSTKRSNTKPREYLFGTLERPIKPTAEDDKFKTITLKDVRRSFRESYMKTDNRAEKQHQPLWFVDVNEQQPKEIATQDDDLDKESYTKTMYMEFDVPNKRKPVSRKETFKITEEMPRPSIKRRETFKIDDPIQVSFITDTYKRPSQSSARNADAIRVELNSVTDRSGKIVPIGIATPYNSQNDREDTSVASRRRFYNKLSGNRQEHHQCRSSQPNLLTVPQNTEFKRRPAYPPNNVSVSKSNTSTYYRDDTDSSRPIIINKNDRNNNFTYDLPSWKKQQTTTVTSSSANEQDSKANLGFDNFYDPNYIVPKNKNFIFGSNTPGYRAVNLKILPKPRESNVRSNPNNWIYNKVHI